MSVDNEKASLSADIAQQHFTENDISKLCCLCNLGERSALGQGELLRFKLSKDGCSVTKSISNIQSHDGLVTEKYDNVQVGDIEVRRQKYIKSNLQSHHDQINELQQIGYPEILPLNEVLCDSYLYIHHMCATWSMGEKLDMDKIIPNVDLIVLKSLESTCTFCGQYGASVTCNVCSEKRYHLPCATAAGCFLLMDNLKLYCKEDLNYVSLLSTDTNNITCHNCSTLGDLSKLILCSTCGDHYHTNCIGLVDLPDTRSGWNCQRCNKCLICKGLSDSVDGRSVKCEHCHKIYHSTCLRPVISSFPKYGWKCSRCRICTDCGARTPGAGASSRWHCHYTICDSCYQQRNKGFSCPICHKAYRAAAYKEMVKCSWCHRFVHSTCDGEADLNLYHKKKENNPDYDYVCPQCKIAPVNENGDLIRSTCKVADMSFLAPSEETLDIDTESIEKIEYTEIRQMDSFKTSKKRLSLKDLQRNKGGRSISQRNNVLTQYSRKRNVRGKTRNILLLSNVAERSNVRSSDDEYVMEKKIILCSTKNKFILSQDICVMCGSVGIEKENCLISCAQCGQCYHPFCVNIKLSNIMLMKGWRCLDCTVCEGCGQKNDEARLILCDECDISYHIYCMSPPLDAVPNGNWKCKWCAVCQKCGQKAENSISKNGILVCGPCASEKCCFICSKEYNNNELMIQCQNCNRWLHNKCGSTANSKEPLTLSDTIDGYICIFCRPNYNSVYIDCSGLAKYKFSTTSTFLNTSGKQESVDFALNISNDCVSTTHWVDGVYVSDLGMNWIKSLTTEIKKKRKFRPLNEVVCKDSGVTAAIESVISATKSTKAHSDIEVTQYSQKKEEVYKDGMIWIAPSDSPPQGFSISTNNEGVSILKKKRQRNLQKLGIGGFNVKNRALKMNSEENCITSNTIIQDAYKRKKQVRRKFKNKISESYPIYLREAFFGKTLLDTKSLCLPLHDNDSSNEFTYEAQTNNVEPNLVLEESKTIVDQKPSICFNEDNLQLKYSNNKNNNFAYSSDFDMSTKSISNPVQSGDLVNVTKVAEKTTCTEVLVSADSLNTCSIKTSHESQQILHKTNVQEQFLTQAPIQSFMNSINDIPFKEDEIDKKVTTSGLMQVEKGTEIVQAGNQKTAEKMRRDEDLGGMATISAVLYANTQHPELKQIYPNWNDRCKQILKIWRSLSTEKKAPFLQHAKDNRSTLRVRRTHQDQEKLTSLQKTIKDQERERVWKQHQTKAREGSSVFEVRTCSLKDDVTRVQSYNFPETKQMPIPENAATTELKPNDVLLMNQKNSPTLPQTNVNNMDNSNSDINVNQVQTLLVKQKCPPTSTDNANRFTYIERNVNQTIGNIKAIPCHQDTLKITLNHQNNPKRNIFTQALKKSLQNEHLANKNKCFKTRHDNKSSEASDLEKLDSDEHVGFGDILGGFGEGDDDELLKSLTAEMGDDFNILEYADPECDVLAESQNLLNKLDFDDSDK